MEYANDEAVSRVIH